MFLNVKKSNASSSVKPHKILDTIIMFEMEAPQFKIANFPPYWLKFLFPYFQDGAFAAFAPSTV
jgi:hypothetical protein